MSHVHPSKSEFPILFMIHSTISNYSKTLVEVLLYEYANLYMGLQMFDLFEMVDIVLFSVYLSGELKLLSWYAGKSILPS